MLLGKGKAQAGFTLIELLAVMAILGILGGLVAGTVVGLGNRGQATRLDGDREGIGKAANAFALEAFPEAFPIVAITSDVTGNVSGVHEIDFKTGLPQDPNKTFVPNFLSELPDSSALISWRIDINAGNVFFAQDGSALIKPSNNRLDVSVGTRRNADSFVGNDVTAFVTNSTGVVSDYLLEFSMAKNEAAPEIIEIQIPANYSVGGGQADPYVVVGMLSATLDTDNPVDPGQVINFGGVLVTSGVFNEWLLIVDYNDNTTTGGGSPITVKPAGEATRVHTVSVVSPSSDSAGTMTINLSRGTDIERNLATETWQLTLLGSTKTKLNGSSDLPFPALVNSVLEITTGQTAAGGQGLVDAEFTITAGSSGVDPVYFVDTPDDGIAELNMFTNPGSTAVYRWLAEEVTTISPVFGDTNFFSNLPGTQGVLIK